MPSSTSAHRSRSSSSRPPATVTEDLDLVRRWAGIIGGRYMGADQAEAYAARNGVPGELLVRATPTRIVSARALAE